MVDLGNNKSLLTFTILLSLSFSEGWIFLEPDKKNWEPVLLRGKRKGERITSLSYIYVPERSTNIILRLVLHGSNDNHGKYEFYIFKG